MGAGLPITYYPLPMTWRQPLCHVKCELGEYSEKFTNSLLMVDPSFHCDNVFGLCNVRHPCALPGDGCKPFQRQRPSGSRATSGTLPASKEQWKNK
jgi:hypothetical protein